MLAVFPISRSAHLSDMDCQISNLMQFLTDGEMDLRGRQAVRRIRRIARHIYWMASDMSISIGSI